MNSPDATLDGFCQNLQLANPFDDNRVTQVESLTGDIPQIHDGAFEQLKLYAQKTRRADKGRGVVVSGPPGIGKSHLLARFGLWASAEKYPFVYLMNLQAGPQDILRTILKTSISILTRNFHKAPQRTRLYKLVSMAIKEAIARHAPGEEPTLRKCRQIYQKLLSDLNQTGVIYDVLWELFEDIQRRAMRMPTTGRSALAVKWLSGDYLDPEEAVTLGLPPARESEDGCVLTLEDMKEVLRILCQFAGYRDRCFVLCFDQVDTLSEDQVQTWTATVHALLDLCPGLLVITSGVDETFLRWTSRGLVSKASWDDRIRQFPLLLSGIDANFARQMIQNRLDMSCSPFDAVAEVQVLKSVDRWFPVGKKTVDHILLEPDGSLRNDLRPRDVISRAGAGWDRQARSLQRLGMQQWLASWNPSSAQMRVDLDPHLVVVNPYTDADGFSIGPSDEARVDEGRDSANQDSPNTIDSIDAVINRKLADHVATRKQRPEELPVDSGNLTGLLQSILNACTTSLPQFRNMLYRHLATATSAARKGLTRQAFQLLITRRETDGTTRRIGVAVADAQSGLAATNMLKRILNELLDPDEIDEAILIVDSRAPLNLATAGKAAMSELVGLGRRFSTQELSFDQYAAIDALESVVGLARAGDLVRIAEDGSSRAIQEAEVHDSHHRHQRYLDMPLIDRLVGKRPWTKVDPTV